MTDENKQVFKLSDELIAVVRELIQLSIITGTNIVDHMRAVRVETAVDNSILPTEEYINQYNLYVQELEKQAVEMQEKMQETLADDTDEKVSIN